MKISTDKYKAIFQKSIDALIVVDGKTRKILEANQATHTILGYKSKELIGKKFSILYPPKSDSSIKNRIEKIKVYGSVFVDEFN
ncbi:MAG: PAS domain S-box protein, partial [bacterium]